MLALPPCAGRSDRVYKIMLIALIISPLICLNCSFYVGMVKAAFFPDDPSSAFGVIANALLDKRGFTSVVAVLMLCSSIAAIMSTLDSAMLAGSNVITIDFFVNGIGKVLNLVMRDIVRYYPKERFDVLRICRTGRALHICT